MVNPRELERNPTTKDELQHSELEQLTAALLTYPVHQAADILFCHGNIIPVGKDQLPHLELTRTIARRFNRRYRSYFPRPIGLLSQAPAIMGLDGSTKMSKSRNNSIALSATADEVVQAVKKAKTDSKRLITYEPEIRPEVANLLQIAALCSEETPQEIAQQIGEGGAGGLKNLLTERLNSYLEPIRQKRKMLEQNQDYIQQVLARGSMVARERAQKTLYEVNKLLGTYIG